ncbi:MAG: hypothetical protein ACK4PK_00390 [Alphaproteobacteria bacterium]
MRLTVFSICALLAITVLPSGCGIKPSFVEPPPQTKADGTLQTKEEARKTDHFPRTYPDPAHDPAPKPAPERLIR